MGLFDEITGEIQAFSCFRKPFWLDKNFSGNGVPWRNNEGGSPNSSKAVGSRQHEFKNIWEQSLDPRGTNRNKGTVQLKSKAETWSIDWKKWPPTVPRFPKGVKIPVAAVPQIDLRLSLSGRWDEISHGTKVIPVGFESKKFFETLGGHLNIAQSETFKVTPTSLLFLHTRAGQFYSVKLKLYNSGNRPRRVRILPPANASFDVVRQTDSKDPISPGRSLIVVVNYRPKTNESLNDCLVFIVDKDGALVVPLISSGVPQPILEDINVRKFFFDMPTIVEEWNCGCCVVGVPRTNHFEIKNVGGEGKFWILSEHEFNNEFLECFLKFKKTQIKETTKELVAAHKAEMDGKSFDRKALIGRGEASGLIKRTRDSLDDESTAGDFGANKGKVQPQIYTNCFRIKPSCFRLQRNQSIHIKVRYLPKDANFHYEKLCILCENGETRWIAVKGLGIERDSDKLIELKAPWTGPPVDLPSDPRTKFVLDCGDLISEEIASLNFSIVNKSCIPLYFFWCIRPVLLDPEASPETIKETNIMERFYEATIFDVEGGNLVYTGKHDKQGEELKTWASKFPLTLSPAQGMLEKKQEQKITFTAECPSCLGYHACVISLFVEQVDEESKNAVINTLTGLNTDQLNKPISHKALKGELPGGDDSSYGFEREDADRVVIIKSPNSPPRMDTRLTPPGTGETFTIPSSLEAETTDFDDEDYVPMRDTITEVRKSLTKSTSAIGSFDKTLQPAVGKSFAEKDQPSLEAGDATVNNGEEMILPLVVAKRSSQQLQRQHELENVPELTSGEAGLKDATDAISANEQLKTEARRSFGSGSSGINMKRKESVNIHFLEEATSANEQEMFEEYGGYEDLTNYTATVVPKYNIWPNREKMLTPVAEVEIWLHSVPLDVTFSPPFIVVNGLVKTCRERLIKVRNGTGHDIEMNFQNISDDSIGAVTCHPASFSVKPFATATFKVCIFFEKYGEMQRTLNGTINLPFSTTPCFLSVYLKAYGPFLQVLTPTINFGIVPLASESMRTLALKNGGDRPLKWVAHIAPEGMEDENKREISGHQARIHDKKLIRIWPEWGLIEPGESSGMQIYFSAELQGEIASYVELMVEGNPQSVISVPIYGEIDLPSLVLENGVMEFDAEDFVQQPVQTRSCTVINPTGFNVPFSWQCPMGRQSKLCSVYIHPPQGIIPAKTKLDFSVSVESYVRDEPLNLDNLYVPCCVEGMREPLILKIISEG